MTEPTQRPADDQQQQRTGSGFTRRGILAVGALGAVGVTAAACSSGSSASQASSAPATPAQNSGGTSPSASPSGTVVVAVADVPVGAAVLKTAGDKPYLISQPEKGKIDCFSAICTHQGCTCNRIIGENLICPCHGSSFNIFTGDVTNPPANQPLAKIDVKVANGQVTIA